MDTVGQEKYNALNENFYKQANCCLLVYDITNKESFNKIKNYYVNKIKENCKSIIKVVLLGNKTDLNDKREVSDKDGHDLALQNEYIFMESSCKNNYNVSDAFTALVEMTNHERKMDKAIDSFSIITTKAKKGKKCC